MVSLSFGLQISPYFVKNHIEMSKIYKILSTFIIFFLPFLYASSLPYLLSYQGLCNCMRMQDASSSKYSIRLGNLFSIITESMQSLD